MVSVKKELWGYTGFSLPTQDSWCKLSNVLDCLADQFLNDGVWLKSSTCQGFAYLLKRTIIVLEPGSELGILKVSSEGHYYPRVYAGGDDSNERPVIWILHHVAGLRDEDVGRRSFQLGNHYELLIPLLPIKVQWVNYDLTHSNEYGSMVTLSDEEGGCRKSSHTLEEAERGDDVGAFADKKRKIVGVMKPDCDDKDAKKHTVASQIYLRFLSAFVRQEGRRQDN
jgi:hypothetical protein